MDKFGVLSGVRWDMSRTVAGKLTGSKTYQLQLEQIRVIYDPSQADGSSPSRPLKRGFDEVQDSSPLKAATPKPVDFDFSTLLSSPSKPDSKPRLPLTDFLGGAENTAESSGTVEEEQIARPAKKAKKNADKKGKGKATEKGKEKAAEVEEDVPMEE